MYIVCIDYLRAFTCSKSLFTTCIVPVFSSDKSIELPDVELNITMIYGNERPGIRRFIYYFLIQCVFYWALVTLAEFGIFKQFWAKVKEACGSRKTHQMVC